MFEKEFDAVRAKHLTAVLAVAVYAPTVEQAVKWAKARNIRGVSCIAYDHARSVMGSTFVAAVLLDPPQPKAHVPEGLPQALSLAVNALGVDHYTKLITVYRNGVESDEMPLDPKRWFCRECHGLRNGNKCWKCPPGSAGHHPVAIWEDQKMPDIKRIRELAYTVGYAVGEHGSKERDVDLIMAPWREDAVSAEDLVAHLVDGLKTENGPARAYGLKEKPLGRLALNIQINGMYKLLDISIMPRVV
jgi:hypothetical protein